MTVASSHIVYCVAMAGTGKTFTGDYLDLIHGFYHVDGDLPLRTAHLPKSREAVKGLAQIGVRYPNLPVGERVPPEKKGKWEKYWGPFFQIMVDSALEAAKTNDKVVITYADDHQASREFVMKKLKEGGAENVTLMYLFMDQDKKLEGLYHRSKRQCEACGISLGEGMKIDPDWEGDGEPTLEEFKAFMGRPGKMGNLSFDEAPPHAKVVDVTGRDVTAIDGVDAALGLQRSGDMSYDEIVKKVVARDHQRDEETPYNHPKVWPELEKEIKEALANAKTGEEEAVIKRRASSIMKLDVMMRGLSTSSLDESTNRRRSALIREGSCKNII